MEGAPRYEVVDTIATGDFAVVYRARDRELGREVAIKQIHQQYLTDQQQLSRYWQEAQLLASLQHPNILTIYDIVRPKGWLILELMRGSLQPATQSDGIDLDYLRLVLMGCLSALQFLHSNGVIHGDIKPSNLLVDAQGRVKLGDFGLARRASSEGGSLLKGTTKYMAPELLSAQFGPVGPASDLYSLGFSAFELMCGAQFETLFPGLSSYGRDKQIAWMMWHAAPDRNMPQIDRVLEGVPEDLARVIQRLVIKDQSRRYQSANEVLRDLRSAPLEPVGLIPHAPDAAAEAANAAAAKRKRRMRYAAILASVVSAALCVTMLWPSTPKPATPATTQPTQGTVLHVYPDEDRIALRVVEARDGKENERVQEVRLTPRYDKVFINNNVEPLDQVRPNDFVRIETTRTPAGKRITEVHAYRPQVSSGRVESVDAEGGQLALTMPDRRDPSKQEKLTVTVPPGLAIAFNGNAVLAGKPVTLADLQPDDRVTLHHIGKPTGLEATELSVDRMVTTDGVIRDVQIDAAKKKRTLTLELGSGENAQVVVWPFADPCEIMINNLASINERRLNPSDLQPGDQATVAHDSHVLRVSASRLIRDSGTIAKIQPDALEVIRQGESTPTRYTIGPDCKVTFNGEPVALRDLRDDDIVEITHRSLGGQNPQALTVAARRNIDRSRWAIVIGIQDYEDQSLSPLKFAVADAKLLRDSLVGRYQVPDDQMSLLTNESLERLKQSIPDRLAQITADAKLVVYFAGHAYRDMDGKVYLAAKNFDLKRISSTGLPLQWLVDELEKCPAKEKLLLLDCSHAGKDRDEALELSTAEMLRSLRTPPGRSPLRTVTAIASCKAGQQGEDWSEKQHGLFAWILAEGYSGVGDKNRDNRLEPTELFGYLQEAMAAADAQLKVSQTPELFLPDDRPPRLNEEAKTAIRKLASYIRQDHIEWIQAEGDYAAAQKAANKQIEPKLLYALLLMKDKQRDQAMKQFDEIKVQRPELLLPLQGITWLRFDKRAYQSGIDELVELISKIPKPMNAGDSYPEARQQIFYWAGQLREYAALAIEEARRPSASSLSTLDAAVARHNANAQRFYDEGRAKSRELHADFDHQIANAESEAAAAKLKVERRRVVRYVEFPYDQSVQEILSRLDR